MNTADVSVEIQTVLIFQNESNDIFMNAFEALKIGQARFRIAMFTETASFDFRK